ncbi:MAG: DUF1049 domain-containing protein [Actinophytocola sp.]|nr:DUF1049 domain-containing protein [Actinophytocola sp.]
MTDQHPDTSANGSTGASHNSPSTNPDHEVPTATGPAPPSTVPPGGHPPTAGLTSKGKIRRTRVSAWWVGLIAAAILLVALLIFIAQNSHTVTIHYLGFEGQASLAVALLLAAVAGLLLVAIPGTARIMQLRRALKKNAAAAQSNG